MRSLTHSVGREMMVGPTPGSDCSTMVMLRLKHVNKVRAKGRTYYYHRPTGTRLKAEPGTLEFVSELDRLNKRHERKAEVRAGTLGGLIASYLASPEFEGLAPRTKSDYYRVFDWLSGGEATPLNAIDSPFVMQLRDLAFRKHKIRFANYVITILSLIFNWGKPRGLVKENPAADVPKIKPPKGRPQANRPWRQEEFEVVLLAASSGVRLAVAIAAYTGLREGDVIGLPWSAYDGRAITLRQGKTGEELWIPVHSSLKAELDAAARVSTIICTNSYDRPWTKNGLAGSFFKLIRRLEAEGKIGEGLTFHGLRHTVAVALADAGCDTRTIMAITGHKAESMAALYTKGADTKRRATAGITALEEHSRNRSRK